MAIGKSGIIELTGSKSGIVVQVFWEETYDTETNKSIISITDIQAKSSDWYGVSYYLDGYISVDGMNIIKFDKAAKDYYFYWGSLNDFERVRVQNGATSPPWESAEIEHEADGTKTVTISVNITGATTSGGAGSGWVVDDTIYIELTDIETNIPEQETITTVSTFYFDGKVVIPLYDGKVIGIILTPPVEGDEDTSILGAGKLGYMVLGKGGQT